MHTPRSTFVALVLAFAASGALAGATAVKCGRTYQDRPCPEGSKLIAPTKAQKGVAAVHPDAACRRRGAQAAKIIEARLAGATEDQQLETAAASTSQMKLIRTVYQQTGTAEEQRAGVEMACMTERQQLAQGKKP